MKRSAISAAFAIAAALLTSCTAHKGRFSLVNKASEPIASATVMICGQTIALKDIERGQSGMGSYDVRADSHYAITVVFRSGKSLEKETGYVTSGMDFQHAITVSDSNIEITDSRIN